MTRAEAIEKIAQGELTWGAQRDMPIRDKRDRELPRDQALDVLRTWAGELPESTFMHYAHLHAHEYWAAHSESMELIPGSPDWVRNFGEPMKEYGPRTCDWGDCDEPAVTLRNDVLGYGWLPVCEGCRMLPGRTWPVESRT